MNSKMRQSEQTRHFTNQINSGRTQNSTLP